jgi:hypothetical protein
MCDVRTVEFRRRIRVYEDDREKYKILDESDVTPGQRENSKINGYSARLHCPRIEDDQYVNVESATYHHSTQVEALRSVRALASELLCRTCMFSGMTPVEVAHQRAELARAEVERTQAFSELAQARQLAIAELQAVEKSPGVLATQSQPA